MGDSCRSPFYSFMNGNLQNIYDITGNPYQPGAYQIVAARDIILKMAF